MLSTASEYGNCQAEVATIAIESKLNRMVQSLRPSFHLSLPKQNNAAKCTSRPHKVHKLFRRSIPHGKEKREAVMLLHFISCHLQPANLCLYWNQENVTPIENHDPSDQSELRDHIYIYRYIYILQICMFPPRETLRNATSSAKAALFDLSLRMSTAGSTSSLTLASFLIADTRCANRHVEIDSSVCACAQTRTQSGRV